METHIFLQKSIWDLIINHDIDIFTMEHICIYIYMYVCVYIIQIYVDINHINLI
jgi:hypothetical protein